VSQGSQERGARAELNRLKKMVTELKLVREILRKAAASKPGADRSTCPFVAR
jgi:hypothetical protein